MDIWTYAVSPKERLAKIINRKHTYGNCFKLASLSHKLRIDACLCIFVCMCRLSKYNAVYQVMIISYKHYAYHYTTLQVTVFLSNSPSLKSSLGTASLPIASLLVCLFSYS